MLLTLISSTVIIVSAIIILGEDTLWTIATVDNWYKNQGTSPNDMWQLVFVIEFLGFWGFGVFWIPGLLQKWFHGIS